MIIRKEGDKSKGICYECGKVVEATYKIRDMKFKDTKGIVKDILVLVCDVCNKTIATPAQSTPAIKATLDRMNKEAASMEIFDLNTKEGRERFLKSYKIK